jgi:hypothetical protein
MKTAAAPHPSISWWRLPEGLFRPTQDYFEELAHRHEFAFFATRVSSTAQRKRFFRARLSVHFVSAHVNYTTIFTIIPVLSSVPPSLPMTPSRSLEMTKWWR